MARAVYSLKLKSRTSRLEVPSRKEPHWTNLSSGLALGYYKGAKGSAWVVKYRDADTGKRMIEKLAGTPDDVLDPNGSTVLTFDQAQKAAQRWHKTQVARIAGDVVASADYSVANALEDYFAHKRREGAKPEALKKAKSAAMTRIVPALGGIPLIRLKLRDVKKWRDDCADAALMRRKGENKARITVEVDTDDEEAVRKRKATANRLLTVLKAALNHALHEHRIESDAAWKQVKPFRNVDAPVIRHLTAEERLRLLNACEPDFRLLVQAALLTGLRYGELTRLAVSDYVEASGSIMVRATNAKSAKKRVVALNDEGVFFFSQQIAGKSGRDLIFLREDGDVWGASHQKRRLEEASKNGKVKPAATFHILRHTYASELAMAGVSMRVIADQLGHADTRMTERHYAHLSPSHIADVVRASLPSMAGGVVESNVSAFRKSG